MDNPPQTILIVPDGNRRWSNQPSVRLKRWVLRNLFGINERLYDRGRDKAEEIIEAAFEEGILCVYFLAATSANLEKRPEATEELAGLLGRTLTRWKGDARLHKTRVQVVGNWRAYLCDNVLGMVIRDIEDATASYGEHTLVILFGHDGVEEEHLCAHLPDVDLMIRTGVRNDLRLPGLTLPLKVRNMAIWPHGKMYWPSFTPRDLRRALRWWSRVPKNNGA